ncbi:zinc-dependent metalloprotease [Rarobacter incanus]|nr:zinc-dependent metalloprotease [Rarobacter incanus]
MAARAAGRIAPPGPHLRATEMQALTDDLRVQAAKAWAPAVEYSGLSGLLDGGGPGAPVHVVDRAGWARGNASAMSRLSSPLLGAGAPAGPAARSVATAEAAGMLALLSSRVLGQFDPYGARPGLYLIAPNMAATERVLDADPTDFRLWVCLHELTHAAQFRAAPWLVEHFIALIAGITSPARPADTDESTNPVIEGVAAVAHGAIMTTRFARALVSSVRGTAGGGLMEGMLSPHQRVKLAEVTAIMSLLEGHADVTMDAVGPDLIPTVADLRRGFEKRRDGLTGAARVIARLLGMEAKLEQYRSGAAFVSAVQAARGRDGIAAAWRGPQTLPTATEITDPAAWLERVPS